MAFLNFLAVAEKMPVPSGVWEWLLLKVFEFVLNYGWRIVVFTVILKLALLPLDFYQRYSMRKNQKITERIAPEMNELKNRYASDKATLQRKQMELNRREGFSYFSSCLPMIVTLALFFWLLAGLNNISQYMSMKQYVEMYDAYGTEYTRVLAEDYDSDRIAHAAKDGASADDISYANGARAAAKEKAQTAVVEVYERELKVEFLWIKNVWSPDVPWRKPILEYSKFIANLGKYAKDPEKSGLTQPELQNIISSEMYNDVTGKLGNDPKNKTNGLLLLPVLSVALSFFSQYVMQKQQKKSGMQNDSMGGNMKMMLFMMPLVMGFCALSYTSVFTLYIIINSLATVVFNFAMTWAINFFDLGGGGKRGPGADRKKKPKKVGGDEIIRYGRPDPNEK
ncbi:MAG: YidC/Oxa1 family membrane protein insertase [Clostridiales bacterium]|jgi:YidC/Oxa1 family membrane protein insertase|nr:YidC/Oxa1 family membrane protein insertase [Clostridiales bacterium]